MQFALIIFISSLNSFRSTFSSLSTQLQVLFSFLSSSNCPAFLMTYCYSHRLMHFSVLIGDTSVCSRLWLTWRPITGKVQRIRSSAVNRASVSHALLPRLRDHCGRVVRKKDHKSHGQWRTQWNISSSGYTGQLHIQSHECYDSMHEIFKRSSQIKTQHEVERWTWRPTPWWGDMGNYFQIIKILIVAWKRESVFFENVVACKLITL